MLVTSADPSHAGYVLECLKHNKYVFCEKPLAPTAEAASASLTRRLPRASSLCRLDLVRRYDPGYRQLKQAIQSHQYGEPLLLHCAHRNASITEPWDNSSAVENSMVHEIDVLRWLLGENYASAEVRFGKSTRKAKEGLHDPQTMILTTESGVRIDVESLFATDNAMISAARWFAKMPY